MSVIRSIAASRSRWNLVLLAMAGGALALAPASANAQGPAAPGSAPTEAWVAPERASRRTNPVPPGADVLKRGQQLFQRECVKCHGNAARGDGKEGLTLTPRPADLMSERVQAQSDGALFWKMSEGRGVMPKATLGEQEKWAVIDYLRSLASNGQAPKP